MLSSYFFHKWALTPKGGLVNARWIDGNIW